MRPPLTMILQTLYCICKGISCLWICYFSTFYFLIAIFFEVISLAQQPSTCCTFISTQQNRRVNGQGQKNMDCKEANVFYRGLGEEWSLKGSKGAVQKLSGAWLISSRFCLSVTWKCSVYVARERLSKASVAAVPRYDSAVCHWST